MVNERLEKLISDALKAIGIEAEGITLEHPKDPTHGDFATNVALLYSKKAGISPREMAEKLVAEIEKLASKDIASVEIAGPGFINFRLSEEYFSNALHDTLRAEESWGKNETLAGKKVIVEYTDPNPFKEFHIGHLMSNAIGESISRLIEVSGAETKRACYQGDAGLHVALAITYAKEENISWQDASDFGVAYSGGAKRYKEDELFKSRVIDTNKKIYERTDPEINTLYDTGLKLSLEYFETIYKKLGTAHGGDGRGFDYYFFESVTGVLGKKVVEENLGTIFEKSEGAIVYKGDESKGLHTRVFINKEGLPTYEAKELGCAKIKYDTYPYDISIVITGNEVNEYFRVLLAAMAEVFPDLAQRTEHFSHGMLRLPTGKMSSRTGDVITAESLLEDVKVRAMEKIKESDIPQKEKEEVADKVALGAVKYSILRQASSKDTIFDFEQSLSFEGDSGPYLQYTFARTHSLLEKAMGHIVDPFARKTEVNLLHKYLLRFPEIVLRASEEREPHHIATYLIEVAREFNSFYGNTMVLDGAVDEPYKLALVKATSQTLKNGLELLGIPTPERM
ncbi:MAG: arginine--tRNA ligase [Patescibacteria group bacterium]